MLIKTKPTTTPKEATALLRADHKLVSDLFAKYKSPVLLGKKCNSCPAFELN